LFYAFYIPGREAAILKESENASVDLTIVGLADI
jgi:hypothetical protein